MSLLINDSSSAGQALKTSTELVQKEKLSKLVATYMVRKGLKLYAYKRSDSTIQEVEIKHGDTAYVIPDGKGNYTWYDPERLKVNIDAKDIHFEALNIKTANARVEKYLSGKISELCNLRKPDSTEKLKKMFRF